MDTPQKKWIETGKALFSLCKAEKTARLHDQQKAYGWERYIDEIFRLDPYKDYIGMQTKLYGLDATIGTRVMKKEISHAELTRIAGCMHQKQNTCGSFTSLIDRIILLAQYASA